VSSLADDLIPFAVEGDKTIYKTGPVYHISAKQGMVLADHTHDDAETIWFLEGEAELQVSEEIERIKAPCQFSIDSNIYHKLTALTDITFIEQRHNKKV